MKYPFLLFFFLFFTLSAYSQTPQWAFKIGSTVNDKAQTCKIAPNGNIYLAGKFSGTMDLDPGIGTYNITCSGQDDIFLACYTSTGSFVWGFKVGGVSYDAAWYIATDAASNVIVCGYFQGGGIDFDPGPGVTTLPFAGGTGLTYYGDGFVAKYASTGAFQWAKGLGGATVYDVTVSLACDAGGNVYAGGVFNGSMAVSPTLTFTAAGGTGYLIKYDPSGNIIWAHNYGMPGGVDCFPRSIQMGANHLYVAGFFGGTANFNPWGGGAFLTAVGTYDPYIAKYDLSGNFVFVKQVKATGGGDDEFGSLSLDAAENMYVSGWSNSSSVTFDPSSPGTSTFSTPGGGGNYDILLAKFNSSGTYQWGKIIGSTGADIGYSIDNDDNFVYCNGQFAGTTDFDPGPGLSSLTSAGGADMYLAKYDVGGTYVCAFRVGSSSNDDIGLGITHDLAGHIYSCGQFGGTAIDFDPTPGTYPLTSIGGLDGYLVKYEFSTDTVLGNIDGDTACAGSIAYVTVNITSGPAGPYTVTFTNGATSFTASGVTSGVPVAIAPTPVSSTTYWVSSAVYTGPGSCLSPLVILSGTAPIIVNPAPGPISGNTPLCVGSSITLSNSLPGGTWGIAPSSVATISSGGIVTGTGTGTATVSYVTTCGTVTTIVTVVSTPGAITGNVPVCPGSSLLLSNPVPGGTWSCAPVTVATISPTGTLTAIALGTATVSYATTCGTVTATVTVSSTPGPITGNTPVCIGSTITLSNPLAGGTWSCTPLSVATISPAGTVTPVAAGTATVAYVTMCGTVTATVTVNGLPGTITGNVPLCPGSTMTLSNSLPGGTWSCAPATTATITATGIVTALAPGTAIVSYATTCGTVTATVTVSSTPGAITGNIPVCIGSTIILSNPLAGGTWSCTPLSVATISPAGTVTPVAAGTATVSYVTTCGTVTATVTVNGLPGIITGNVPLCPGSTMTLSNSLPGGTWSCVPATVATISPTGTVTAIVSGTAIVSYATTCGTVTATVTVDPLPGPIAGNTPVCMGSVITLSNPVAGGTWSCVPATVAVINPAGLVTAIAPGTAIVSYTTACGSVSTIVTINGLPGPITGNAPVCPGDSVVLSNSLPGGTWSCTPMAVATISVTGVATGVSTGTATVSYTTTCGTATVIVTVNTLPGVITGNTPVCAGSFLSLGVSAGGGTWSCLPATVATISPSGTVTAISAGTAVVSYVTNCGTATAIVTVTPLPGPIMGNVPVCYGSSITLSNTLPGGTWACIPPTVATISPTGFVTTISPGTATVSYITTCGTVTTIVTVIPLPGAIAGNTPLCPGTTIALSNPVSGGTWSCAPATIATISATGTVTAIAAGTAIVSYVTACGAVVAIVTVNPLPGPITGSVAVCQGSSIALSNTLPGGIWTCAPTTVATIGATGLVTTISPGTATVAYVTTCATVTTIVTVIPLPGAITGNIPMCPGGTISLSNPIPGGGWTCAPVSIATVNPATGDVTAISTGTATVAYTTVCGAVSVIVTVDPLPGAIVGNTPVCAGAIIALSNSLPGGTWSCVPASVAIISASGIVTTVMAGTATVSYTTACGAVAVIVTVNPTPGPISGSIPVCVGSTLALSNSLPGGVWSCTPMSVATISTGGVVTTLSAGTAIVTYRVGTCMSTTIVTVNPVPVIAGLSFINPLCGGAAGSITLMGLNPGSSYTLHYTGIAPVTTVVSANSLGNIVITGLMAGSYSAISVVNLFGCVSNIAGPVTLVNGDVPLPPVVFANNPCAGDTLKLGATCATAGVSFHWAGPSGFSAASANPYLYPAQMSNAGIYTVTVTLGACIAATTVNVAIHPQPVVTGISFNGPGSCYGTDGWIELSGLVAGESYIVTYMADGVPVAVTITANASGKLRISGLSSGTYTNIVLTSSFGCISAPNGPVTLIFSGKPPAPVIEHNNPCVGETLLLSAKDAMPGGTYTWSYPDGGGSTLQNHARHSVTTSAAGIYTVTYSVAGCPTTATANVFVYLPVMLTNVTPDQTIPFGSSIQLNASGATLYRWVPNDGSLNNPNINNPVATPTESTTYTVYGTGDGSCPDSAHVTITIGDEIEEYIPSSFTPNGDGLNDIFRIRNMRTQKLVEFSIYNRFGERVYFNSYSPDGGWDGTYKGIPCDVGTYFYHVIVGLRDGTNRIHKGDLTLIR